VFKFFDQVEIRTRDPSITRSTLNRYGHYASLDRRG